MAIFVFDLSSLRSMQLMQNLFDEMAGDMRVNGCLLLVLGMKKDLLSRADCEERMNTVVGEMKNQGIAQFYATTAVDDRDFEKTKADIMALIVDHIKNKTVVHDTDKLKIDQSHDDMKEPNCHC